MGGGGSWGGAVEEDTRGGDAGEVRVGGDLEEDLFQGVVGEGGLLLRRRHGFRVGEN
jgi:hypothetical protein